MSTFDQEWADDYMRRLNQRWFGYVPTVVQYDDGPWERFYMGAPDDTAAPKYLDPGMSRVFRCTCGCSEVTHQFPGGHCIMPYCKDEPCTVKKPDPWLEQVREITGLARPWDE